MPSIFKFNLFVKRISNSYNHIIMENSLKTTICYLDSKLLQRSTTHINVKILVCIYKCTFFRTLTTVVAIILQYTKYDYPCINLEQKTFKNYDDFTS